MARFMGGLVGAAVLAAALMGCGGSGGGHTLTGSVQVVLDASWTVSSATTCTQNGGSQADCTGAFFKAGTKCPADVAFGGGSTTASTLIVEDAAKKTVATVGLQDCRYVGNGDATLQFSTKVPSSDFYTVKIEGQGGEQTYSRADLERTKWRVSLKAS